MDLVAIEESIEKQTDVVAHAPSSLRYSEILRLQMLREMREILEQAYQYRLESAQICRILREREAD